MRKKKRGGQPQSERGPGAGPGTGPGPKPTAVIRLNLLAETNSIFELGHPGEHPVPNQYKGFKVVARVTDGDGEPVTGLTKGNFRVHRGFDSFTRVDIGFVRDIDHLPGIYEIPLDDSTGRTFARTGQFVYIVSLKGFSGGNRITGETLVSVVKGRETRDDHT